MHSGFLCDARSFQDSGEVLNGMQSSDEGWTAMQSHRSMLCSCMQETKGHSPATGSTMGACDPHHHFEIAALLSYAILVSIKTNTEQ